MTPPLSVGLTITYLRISSDCFSSLKPRNCWFGSFMRRPHGWLLNLSAAQSWYLDPERLVLFQCRKDVLPKAIKTSSQAGIPRQRLPIFWGGQLFYFSCVLTGILIRNIGRYCKINFCGLLIPIILPAALHTTLETHPGHDRCRGIHKTILHVELKQLWRRVNPSGTSKNLRLSSNIFLSLPPLFFD